MSQPISADAPHINLISYEVEGPKQQERLVAALAAVVERWVRHWPGFEFADFHVSTDGRRVFNFTRWASAREYQEFVEGSEAEPRMRDIEQAASEAGAEFLDFRGYRSARTVAPGTGD